MKHINQLLSELPSRLRPNCSPCRGTGFRIMRWSSKATIERCASCGLLEEGEAAILVDALVEEALRSYS